MSKINAVLFGIQTLNYLMYPINTAKLKKRFTETQSNVELTYSMFARNTYQLLYYPISTTKQKKRFTEIKKR